MRNTFIRRPNLRNLPEKSQDQLDLQALQRVRSKLRSGRSVTINQVRVFLTERCITIHKCLRAVRNSLLTLLDAQREEISPRMRHVILGLHEDWLCLDDQIESVSSEIARVGQSEAHCRDLRTIPGVEPIISTALSRRSGKGESFENGRDMAAWVGHVPSQNSTGGRSTLGRISKRGCRHVRKAVREEEQHETDILPTRNLRAELALRQPVR